jgi:hypothetical protein
MQWVGCGVRDDADGLMSYEVEKCMTENDLRQMTDNETRNRNGKHYN